MPLQQICSDSTVDPGVKIGEHKCTDPNAPVIAAVAIAVLGVLLLLVIGFFHRRSESARAKEYVLEDVEMQKIRSERKKSRKAKKKSRRQRSDQSGSESSGGSGSSSSSSSDSDDDRPAVPSTLPTDVSEGTPPELPTVPEGQALSRAGAHHHSHRQNHNRP
eukprot:COSAG02_NODE_2585_length_8476_cov_18.560821_2_plen_162_part_00